MVHRCNCNDAACNVFGIGALEQAGVSETAALDLRVRALAREVDELRNQIRMENRQASVVILATIVLALLLAIFNFMVG